MGILIVISLVVLPIAAHAVSHNTPESYSLSTYCWVLATAITGGLTSVFGRIRRMTALKVCGELVVSAFSGVITFWLCEYLEINQLASAALVGIVGHMGSRGMETLEKNCLKILHGKLKVTITEEKEND